MSCGIRRNRKADALVAARAGVDGGVDSKQVALRVYERTA